MSCAPTACRPAAARLTRPDGAPVRLLVVDEDDGIRGLLAEAFAREGWDVRAVRAGTEALRVASGFRPDAAVVEVLLPDVDGTDLLRRLRAADPRLPVVFLTVRDGVDERLAGLEAGADDYVTKPFSLEELIARLRGLVRRAGRAVADRDLLVLGDLLLDEEDGTVTRGGQRIRLTRTEFALLRWFMRNPRRVLSRDEILERVWADSSATAPNIVELYVSHLRRKIDKGRAPMIHTVWGVGYALRPAAPTD